MNYPIDADDLNHGVLRLLDADSLCKGVTPGFQIVNVPTQGAVQLGAQERLSLTVTSLSAHSYEDIDHFLRAKEASRFVKLTALKMLGDADVQEPYISSRWDYHAILGQLGESGPPKALLFPGWRGSSNSLPRGLPVPTFASHAVGASEVVFVFGENGHYAINRKPGLQYQGSESHILLYADVWRVGPMRPRVYRVELTDISTIDVPLR